MPEFGDAAKVPLVDRGRMTTTHHTDEDRYFTLEPNGGERLRFLGASTLTLKLDAGSASDVAFYEYVSEPGEFPSGTAIQLRVSLATNNHVDLDQFERWEAIVEFTTADP